MIDECNMVGIDLWWRNYLEDLDGLDLREVGFKGVLCDCDFYVQCQKNICVVCGFFLVDWFIKFLLLGQCVFEG